MSNKYLSDIRTQVVLTHNTVHREIQRNHLAQQNIDDVHIESETSGCEKFFQAFDIPENIPYEFPIFTLLNSIFMVSIYFGFLDYYNRDFYDGYKINDLVELGALELPNSIEKYYVWNLIICSYLHINFVHIIGNLLLYIPVSIYLELKYHSYRISIIYWSGCIASSLFYTVVTLPVKYNVMVGASGAIYSLLGLYISEIYINWETIKYKTFKLILFVLLIAEQICLTVYWYDPYVAIYAHIGGLVFGLIPATLYIPNYKYRDYEIYFGFISLIGLIIYFVCFPIYLYAQLWN